MSFNGGVVLVELASGQTSEAVAAAVAGYWVDAGASPTADPVAGLSADDVATSGRLGALVQRASHGWVAIVDTEGDTADAGLARALARKLATRALAIELCGAIDDGAGVAYGKWLEKPKLRGYAACVAAVQAFAPGALGLRIDEVADRSAFHALQFERVPADAYHSVPFPKRASGPRAPWIVPLAAAFEALDAAAGLAAIERRCRSHDDRLLALFDYARRKFYGALHDAAEEDLPRGDLTAIAGWFVDLCVGALRPIPDAQVRRMHAGRGPLRNKTALVELLYACELAGRPDAAARFAKLTEGLRVDLSDEESLTYLVEYAEQLGDPAPMRALARRFRSAGRALEAAARAHAEAADAENEGALDRCAEDPELSARALYNLAVELGGEGHHATALRLLDHAARRPKPPWQVFNNALAHAMLASESANALRDTVTPWLARGAHLEADQPAYLHNVACARARLGEDDAALAAIARALDCGADAATLRADPDLRRLAKDPRFVALLG